MLGTGSHRYHRQSPQNTAAELGDRQKEDERGEREREEEEEEEEEDISTRFLYHFCLKAEQNPTSRQRG